MLKSTKINSTRSVEGTRGTLRDRPDHVICGSGILTLKVPRRYTWKLMTFFGVKNGQVAPNITKVVWFYVIIKLHQFVAGRFLIFHKKVSHSFISQNHMLSLFFILFFFLASSCFGNFECYIDTHSNIWKKD